jgi:hypothetical protein
MGIDGHIAETAINNYHVSFADQGKQSFVFSVSGCSKQK